MRITAYYRRKTARTTRKRTASQINVNEKAKGTRQSGTNWIEEDDAETKMDHQEEASNEGYRITGDTAKK